MDKDYFPNLIRFLETGLGNMFTRVHDVKDVENVENLLIDVVEKLAEKRTKEIISQRMNSNGKRV